MPTFRDVLEDLVTLAAGRDDDPDTYQASPERQATSSYAASASIPAPPVATTDAGAAWSAFPGLTVLSGSLPTVGGTIELGASSSIVALGAPGSGAEAERIATLTPGVAAPTGSTSGPGIVLNEDAASAGVDLSLAAASTSPAGHADATPAKTSASGASPLLTVNQAALATTQPQQIDFSASDLSVFGTDTTVSLSLPSVLYQQYGFSTGVSFGGFGLTASASIAGGIKGGVTLTLGQFSPDFPVTIDPGVVPFVQDGQVFSVDPSLISTDDASFSLSLPQANVSLDFGLQAKAGLTLSFPTVPIGFSLPYVGFIGYHLSIPSQFIGYQVGSIFQLKQNTTINIGGIGSVSLSELQSSVVNSGTVSALAALPTLELSGSTAPFFSANIDLVSILAQKVPDPFAVLQGSKSFLDGIAKLGYKLLSLPVSGSLWLHEDVTLTPVGITETVEDTLTHQIQTGTLGQRFDFTAPASGNGTVPLSITFGLELAVTTEIDLDGNIELTAEGPSVSASIAGISKTIGPLGNFNLFDIQGEIAQLYSHTSMETLTQATTVDLQNFASAVTQTVTKSSGTVDLSKPATDLLVAAGATVTGGAYGVLTGTLSAAMVTDAGLITATGVGVELQEGGSVYLEAGGKLTGAAPYATAGVRTGGVQVDAVINDGAISGFEYGVKLVGGMVENATGATIDATALGVEIGGADASIVNNGAIVASSGIGVELTGGGDVYNAVAGYIRGALYGVYGNGAPVSVENHCTLSGGGSAVHVLDGGSVTNLAGAYMLGGGAAVILDGGSSVVLSNQSGARITGKVGVSLFADSTTVIDYGTISGSLASVELYGRYSNTLVLDPGAALKGGAVRFSSVENTISLVAAYGGFGTLTGLGAAQPFSGTIAIGQGAAWDVSGNFTGDTLSGLTSADTLTDTGIVWRAGERAEFNAQTDVLSIFLAGKPTSPIGTIQLYGELMSAPILSDGASGKLQIAFSAQQLSTLTANSGAVYMSSTSFFGPNLTIAAGVTVTPNYYGANSQAYGVLVPQERATLTNYGTILGNNRAVDFFDGGMVTNLAGGLISATTGVELGSDSLYAADSVTVNNAGAVSASSYGVLFHSTGTVTNLSGGKITSSGLNAVAADAFTWVFNQGTMTGARHAIRLFDGGQVYNETGGLLIGDKGAVDISGESGTVINCGTIRATASSSGVYLGDGGLVMNESGDITGVTAGVQILGAAGTIGNGATIKGVLLADGGMIVNGPTGTISAVAGYGVSFYNAAGPVAAYLRNKGLITGIRAFGDDTIVNDGTINGAGVVAGAAGAVTVTNAGLIQGTGGAVQFSSASDRLIVESGAKFVGTVKGGGGTLELASATGVINGLGGAGKLTGGATMNFGGFADYAIDAGASWTLNGPAALAAGDTLSVAGTLSIAGTLTSAGVISGVKGSKIVLKNADLAGGTLASSGVVVLTGVGNLLDGTRSALTNQAAITIGNGTALTLQGAIANAGSMSLAATTLATRLIVGAAGATLSGGGSVAMGANALNTLTGASAAATLTNQNNTIKGSGQLGAGSLDLINAAAGIIEQTGALALTLNTGGNTVTNAGLIEAAGGGGMIIDSGVNDSGTLEAVAGTMTFAGAVSGAGAVIVNGGQMVFDAADSFTGGVDIKNGVLELAAINAAGSGSITFAPSATGSATLQLDAASTPFTNGADTFATPLVNFGTNGFIDIKGMTFAAGATVSRSGDVMTVSSDGQTLKFTLAGTLPSLLLVVANAGGGIQVNTEGLSTAYELAAAVQAADQTGAGAGAINLLICGDIDLTNALAPIDLRNGVNLVIEGSGLTINGPAAGFDVSSGSLTIEDLNFGGSVTVARGCDFSGYGVVSGPVVNNGQVEAEGGVLTLQGPVSGSGTVLIGKGADAVFDGAVSQTIAFITDSPGTLTLDAPSQTTGRILDFTKGDVIDLAGIKATSLKFSDGALSIYEGQTLVATLDIAGTGSRQLYALSSDGHGGTEITAAPWTSVGPTPIKTPPSSTSASARLLQLAAGLTSSGASSSVGSSVDISYHSPMLASP